MLVWWAGTVKLCIRSYKSKSILNMQPLFEKQKRQQKQSGYGGVCFTAKLIPGKVLFDSSNS